MSGHIVYEVTGNECDGMTIRYRFVTNIATAESNYQTDQQTSTFESPDGKEFTFLTKTFVDQRAEATVRGNALRTPSGLKVSLAEPKQRTIDLPDAAFISTHLVTVIERPARARSLCTCRFSMDRRTPTRPSPVPRSSAIRAQCPCR